MKRFADKNRSELEFQVNDWVLICLQPYRQHSIQLRRYQKLALQYFSPFRIQEQIGQVAYRLVLPSQSRIHPVFHVSQLKRYIGDLSRESFLPLPLHLVPEGPICQPITILSSPHVLLHDTWTRQFLIRWDGSHQDTWESQTDLERLYPNLNLEDKVPIGGDGIVMDPRYIGPKSNKNVDQNVIERDQHMGQPRRSLRTKTKTWKLRELEE